MNTTTTWFCTMALIAAAPAAMICPQQASASGNGTAVLKQGAENNKTSYLIFYRTWDSASSAMAEQVKAHVARFTTKANWTTVSVTQAAEKNIVDKFGVSRAPMPLLLAVQPSGAVTGAYLKKVTATQLVGSLVSPTTAKCMQLLQQNKLVLVCVQSSSRQAIPQGVRQFQADPHFANRTKVLTVQLNDRNEAAFFSRLKINPQAGTSSIVFMAPPGVLVGTFAVSASGNDLARALHAAGKCCDDPNCKHHHR